jgi:hypothetical protein
MVHHIAGIVPNSHSVALWRDPYYQFAYDSELPVSDNGRFATGVRALWGPVVLGSLVARACGVLYLGEWGFLTYGTDNRRYEFEFLRSKGCLIACYFVGGDIRAPRKMKELETQTGLESLGTHLGRVDPVYDSDEYDAAKREIAAAADEFATVIFSASVDQRSYLKRTTEPITYFYPDEKFPPANDKFSDLRSPVILHAPSNPIIKGTPHVRDAIDRLRADGYVFEYVELNGVSNATVRAELERAHIVLNQFYAYIPGVFGIEALAARCAVLMSADENIEPDLPRGSNDAWLVTRYSSIYDNLKYLLDHPDRIEPLAEAGRDWAWEHVSFENAGPRLRETLRSAMEGS